MTREELKEHCLKEIKMCEMWARLKGEDTHSKLYEEHKLILELLEQEPKSEWQKDHEILKAYSDGSNEVLDKIRAEIEQLKLHKAQYITTDNKVCIDSQEVLNVIDKYKEESEG